MDPKDRIAVVEKYVEAFDKADMNLIREIYADDAVVEDPVGAEPFVGIEAICKFYEQGFGAGAKLTLTDTPRCPDGANVVTFNFSVKIGDTMQIDPIDVFEFNDQGKVTSMKAFWGSINMVQ